MATTTSAAVIGDQVPVYLTQKQLSIAEVDTIWDQLAEPLEFPEGNGRTIRAVRFNRVPLPTSPLVEGVTPTGVSLTTATVEATVDQWGVDCVITDVAKMTAKHPLLEIANSRLGTNHAELRNREALKTAMGGTNVSFAGVATSRSALAAGEKVDSTTIRKTRATLRRNGARGMRPDQRMVGNRMESRPSSGPMYAMVCDPQVSQDIQADSTFVGAAQQSNIQALFKAEVGTWLGNRVIEDNAIPVLTRLSTTGITIGKSTTTGTGFLAGSTVLVRITRLDPTTGFEREISADTSVTDAAAFTVTVTFSGTIAAGTYGIYVSTANGAIPILQEYLVHASGGTEAREYLVSGTPATGETIHQLAGPLAPPIPPASVPVHMTFVLGKEALGSTGLGRYQAGISPAGSTDSDPLSQRRHVFYKQMLKFMILNPNFFRRIESASAFD